MIIDEIMQYLANNIIDLEYDATGVSGNLFDNTLPASPDTAVMVENTGGYPRDMRLTQYLEPSIRILVRGTQDPRIAKSLAYEIIEKMGTFGSDTFVADGIKVIKCQAVQGYPINIGRDDNERHRFSINFDLQIKKEE